MGGEHISPRSEIDSPREACGIGEDFSYEIEGCRGGKILVGDDQVFSFEDKVLHEGEAAKSHLYKLLEFAEAFANRPNTRVEVEINGVQESLTPFRENDQIVFKDGNKEFSIGLLGVDVNPLKRERGKISESAFQPSENILRIARILNNIARSSRTLEEKEVMAANLLSSLDEQKRSMVVQLAYNNLRD